MSEQMTEREARRNAAVVLAWAPHSFVILLLCTLIGVVVLAAAVTGYWTGMPGVALTVTGGLVTLSGIFTLVWRDQSITAKAAQWNAMPDPREAALAEVTEYRRVLAGRLARYEAEIAEMEGPHHR